MSVRREANTRSARLRPDRLPIRFVTGLVSDVQERVWKVARSDGTISEWTLTGSVTFDEARGLSVTVTNEAEATIPVQTKRVALSALLSLNPGAAVDLGLESQAASDSPEEAAVWQRRFDLFNSAMHK